jgi:hypothetical protein
MPNARAPEGAQQAARPHAFGRSRVEFRAMRRWRRRCCSEATLGGTCRRSLCRLIGTARAYRFRDGFCVGSPPGARHQSTDGYHRLRADALIPRLSRQASCN